MNNIPRRENKPGANGNAGADAVSKAPANGSTLLLCDVGALAISPAEFSSFFERERAKWAAVVTKSGIKLD